MKEASSIKSKPQLNFLRFNNMSHKCCHHLVRFKKYTLKGNYSPLNVLMKPFHEAKSLLTLCHPNSNVERKLCSGYLGFHIQYRDHALCMDLPDGLQSSSIHGILMASVLQIVIVADVLHHLVMRHKVIVLSILLILLWRPSCV